MKRLAISCILVSVYNASKRIADSSSKATVNIARRRIGSSYCFPPTEIHTSTFELLVAHCRLPIARCIALPIALP
jgi:hypothetical protein